MSYNQKLKSINLFEAAVDTLVNNESPDFKIGETTKTIFVTNFGFVEGEVILNEPQDSDAPIENFEIELLHRLIKNLIDESEKDSEPHDERLGSIPLKNVKIRTFSNDIQSLDYFLLFADQVVGLTLGESHQD